MLSYNTKVNIVSDLFRLPITTQNNAQFITNGYSVAGVGAGEYYYDAASTATINGGTVLPGIGGTLSFDASNVFNGTAGTGRFTLRDVNKATVDMWGAVGDDVTDDWAPIQRAINAGGVVQLESRTYRITKTLARTLLLGTAGAPSLVGRSLSTSILSVDTTLAIPIIDLTEFDSFRIDKIAIQKRTSLTTPGNWTGVKLTDCQHFELNVKVIGAALGIDLVQANSGSFFATLDCQVRYCTKGIRGVYASGLKGRISLENITQQGYDFTSSSACDLTINSQGNSSRTIPSRLNDCHGCTFTCYEEDGAASSQPYLEIGNTQLCTAINVTGLFGKFAGSSNPVIALDRFEDGMVTASTSGNGQWDAITTTNNTRRVTINATDSTTAVTQPALSAVGWQSLPAVNEWPDSMFAYGLPGTVGRSLTVNNAAATEETTIVPPGFTRSLKVQGTVGTVDCRAQTLILIDDFPHLARLRGQRVGVGFWVFIPTNHPSVANTVGAFGYIESNAGNSTLQNQRWVKGKWFMQIGEVDIAANATYFVAYYNALGNGASPVADANTVAYFGGPLVWAGGFANADAIVNGFFAHSPFAADPYRRVGAGDPSGVVVAPIGTEFLRTDGGVNTTLYVKESGPNAVTGWAAK